MYSSAVEQRSVMCITLFLFAAVAVTQGSTPPPSSREGSLTDHSDNSILYSLLQAAGFTDSCVSGALDMCSSAQEKAHFPSLIQNMQEVKVELQKVQAEVKEEKATVQQNVQEVKMEIQKVKTEVQEGKQEIQEVKEILQQVIAVLIKNESRPRHCMDLLVSGDRGRGLRQVYPYSARPDHNVTVYCDQIVDGGGWTVFQRRVNNSIRQNFNQNWREYQAGFGDLNGEFWLGLDLLSELASGEQELRIDLHDYEGQHRWAKYGTFQVGPEDTNYRLTVGRYSGDAADSLTYHNGEEFSTRDADHDKYPGNCAERHQGGWWYRACVDSNLNGHKVIVWYDWRGWTSLMGTSMMLRPVL